MSIQLPSRDWEAISAYLDNKLSDKDRIRLEARLQSEPALNEALRDLRRTHFILRNSPRLNAPRNFTLTPQMAGFNHTQRSGSSAFPVLRLASILATFFFIVVTVGSFAIQYLQPSQSLVVRSEVENARPGGMGGGGGGAGEAPPLAPLPTQEALTLQSQSEPAPPQAKALMVTPIGREVVTPTTEVFQALQAPEGSTSADASPAAGESHIEIQATPSVTQISNHQAWTFLGILQIVLALLAAITGLGALYLRRSASS